MAGATDIVQQLPQLEALCERLYNSKVRLHVDVHYRNTILITHSPGCQLAVLYTEFAEDESHHKTVICCETKETRHGIDASHWHLQQY